MKHILEKAFNTPSTTGVIYALTATTLLSFKGIFVKLAYAEEVSLMDLMYYRILFALPLLWTYAYYKKGKDIAQLPTFKQLLNCILAGFLGYYMATMMDFYSLKHIPVNVSRIFLYTFPIYVLVWNALIDRKLPPIGYILAFILVQIGLYFTLGGFATATIQQNRAGAIFALIAAISYSLYIIINQQTVRQMGSVLFTVYAITFSFLFLNIHFLVAGIPLSLSISAKGVTIIFIISVFCTFAPLLLIAEAIHMIGATKFSLFSVLGPIITAVFAYLILGEEMTPQQMIGATLVIAVIYVMETRRKKMQAKLTKA